MECIFCKIIKGEIPADVVYRDEEMVAFRDIRPQAPVHVLIIPTKHVETVLDLTPDAEGAKLVGEMILLANKLAREEGIDQKGFRLVMNCRQHGGQDVFHIHLHLLGGRAMHWPPG